MPIIVEFRRHSHRDVTNPISISQQGMDLARRIGSQQLRHRRFTDFFASPIWLTQQTMAAFAEGATDFVIRLSPPPAPIYLPSSQELNRLYVACRFAELDGHGLLEAAFDHNRPLVDRSAKLMAQIFTCWMRTLPENAHLLVVGHSPEMEFIPYGLNGTLIPPLAPCQGFRIKWDNGLVAIESGDPLLQPSERSSERLLH